MMVMVLSHDGDCDGGVVMVVVMVMSEELVIWHGEQVM